MLLGKDGDDPWDPDRLAWPLLGVIDDVMGDPRVRRPHHPPRRRRPDRRPLHPPLRRGPTPGRPVLLLCRAASRAHRPVARGPRHRRRRGRPRPRPALAGGAVAPAGRPGRRTAARRTPRRHGGAAPRRWRRPRPAAAAVALRPHPAARDRGGAAARAGRAARRPPLAAAGLARPLGRTGADRPGRPGGAGRRRVGRRWSAIRCSAHWDATRASCAAPSAMLPACRGRGGARAARHPARLAPARPACQHHARCRDPRPAARPGTSRCRCTPATAPPVRSTCCARCWSACWRTTPRSSRATSS